MSWLIIALIAYFLLAGSVVLDKMILSRPIKSPVLYATYVGLVASYSVLALPVFISPASLAGRWDVIFIALASGVLNILGLSAFFAAVKKNDISRVAPFIAVFVAVFVLILGGIFSVDKVDLFEFAIFVVLVVGALFASQPDIKNWTDYRFFGRRIDFMGILAAFLFAASIIAVKYTYQETTFLNGFLLARNGDFLTGVVLFLLFRKKLRIGENWRSIKQGAISWIAIGKLAVAGGMLLQHYAMFLGSAILVQALSGIQYFFVWFIVLIVSKFWKDLSRERFPVATALVLIGFVLLTFSQRPAELTPGVKEWGVTFSKPWAERLGLNWKEAYWATLADLKASHLRIPAYWNEVEKKEGVYDFTDLDWQIDEAGKRGAEVVLVVGRRVPRWPECHEPEWLKNSDMEIRNSKLLEYVSAIIQRYKDNPAVKYWQVENEPFLKEFGICPEPDPALLDKEVALVKSLDSRPVVVTDSGEMGWWINTAKRADIFGTTMYGVVWRSGFPSGYVRYPKMPSLFYFKANLAKTFAGARDIIISELQAEPWGPAMIYDLSPDEQRRSMDIKQFRKNVKLAQSVGFREAYFWGVEWWYKEKLEGRGEIWQEAKKLF